MPYRKFLWVLAVLVLALLAIFRLAPGRSSAEKAFWWLMTPRFAFVKATIPEAPNYQDPRFWAERTPASEQTKLERTPVFFIHQTSWRSAWSWNQDISFPDASERYAWTKQWQTSVFDLCCAVFAPYYRQATFAAYWTLPEGYKARNLAYQDVAAAFATFVAQDLNGRPFILAGHSQGAEHGLRLLKSLQGTPLATRLVAAYLIGIPLGKQPLASELGTFPLCQSEDQTQCIVTYMSFRRNYPTREIMTRGAWPGPDGYQDQTADSFACVNPLSWRTDNELASAAMHLGSTQFPGEQGITSAQCEGGALVLDDLDSRLDWPLDGNYHLYDLILFSENLRQNALLRTQSFKLRHSR